MGTCPDTIRRLIDRFGQQSDQVRSPDYNETQLRIDFVNPMFAELGWDLDNRQGFAEQYREVVHEDRVKVAGQRRRLVSLVDSMHSLNKREQSAKLPQDKDRLHCEIESTDRRIDELVYELYGLTDEEIQIVEEGTG